MKLWYVYVMTNKTNSILYIRLTNNIEERAKEHMLKKYPNSFTAKYNCNKLVYFEEHVIAENAIKREEQLKKWKRDWEIKLIADMNPGWNDLLLNWNLNYKN